MCGRFTAAFSDAELRDISKSAAQNASADEMTLMKTEGEIFPSEVFPVMTGAETFRPMAWGFRMEGKKQLIINARSETIMERPMFQKPAQRARCLIQCHGFYEWDKRKQKYLYKLPGGGRMYLAGIWRMEPGSGTPRFTILTRQAVGDQLEIHDRIPVIVPPELIYTWLAESAKTMEIIQQAITELWIDNLSAPEPTLFDMV